MPDFPLDRAPSQSAVPSSDERERVVELLTQYFAQDRISIEEFERRVTTVYAAPDRAALQQVTADLQPAARAGEAGGGALVGPDDVPAHDHLRAVLSNTTRGGPLLMPRYLRVDSVMGNVHLDLRGAEFSTGVTVIDVHAVMANVEIVVLPDVPVEIVGGAFLGSFRVAAGRALAAPSPNRRPLLVRVTGRSVLANVEVKHLPAEEEPHGW